MDGAKFEMGKQLKRETHTHAHMHIHTQHHNSYTSQTDTCNEKPINENGTQIDGCFGVPVWQMLQS